jgi:hypothetical protein
VRASNHKVILRLSRAPKNGREEHCGCCQEWSAKLHFHVHPSHGSFLRISFHPAEIEVQG